MLIEVNSEDSMRSFGKSIGDLLCGGEIIELIGDVGAGKTVLTKGIAIGLGIDEYIQSPSFTINRVYQARDNLKLVHYDFYRLDKAGIMEYELEESIGDNNIVTVIEWAGLVDSILPDDKLQITITSLSESSRRLEINAGGDVSNNLIDRLTK